jgi:3-hydroxyisobutyrate dehydrogenase-like beta-hydroxyacid dehydrogenase
MGLPMIRHLVPLGYAVRAYDVVPEKVSAAAAAGAAAASSPAEVVAGADLVLLNLPTVAAVEQAVFADRGVASAMRAPQLVVDFSTIPVEKCRAFGARLRADTGCGWIDAPVSGGPPASGSGTLTVMAGGEDADIARARPLFDDVAGRFTHMGPPAAGMAAKMLNQLIVGIGHVVMAEAIVLAEAAGIDAARLPECLADGHADSALLQRLYPRMQRRDFAPMGYVRQLLKDLEMVHEYGAGLKAPMPMMSAALSLYRIVAHQGHTELDTAAIIKAYEG